jgi:hypothetical protein
MSLTANIIPLSAAPQPIEPSIVSGPGRREGYVRITNRLDPVEKDARIAVYPRPRLASGDEVLTMVDGRGRIYVVGVLSCRQEAKPPIARVELEDGSYAEIDHASADGSLKLYSKANELLVDYRSRTGTVRVNVAAGNLEFSTANGSIAFHSAKDILMDGHHVAVNARNDLRVGVEAPTGSGGPVLSMKTGRMLLASPALEMSAQRATLFLQEAQIAGKKLLGRIGSVHLIARKFESVADTVMARAKNVYRTVSELSQLKAGRQRVLIEKTSHLKARQTILKSEGDFKVKAEKIHLG